MKHIKQVGAIVCALALMLTAAVIPVSATVISGAGQSGQAKNIAFGCDVSMWNVNTSSGNNYSYLNFAKMKADGCDFVIMRCGYEGSSSHTDTKDSAFLQLYKNARAADMKLGIYFYSLATTYAGAKQDAEWVINLIESNDMYFEYPIYYDVEDKGQTALGASAMTQLCLGWAETLEAAGYCPGMYSTLTNINKLGSSYTSKYEVWYAAVAVDGHGTQYSPHSRMYNERCGMWQYAWYDCNFDGVYLDMLDVDVAYKDYPTLIAAGGLNNLVTGHTITFESNGGSAVSKQIVADGKTVTKPADPTKDAFTFAGWYTNPELTDPYDFNTPVPYSFTLYAKWAEAYWGGNTNIRITEGAKTPDYTAGGSGKVYVYANDVTSSMDLYNGVEVDGDWSWPHAYETYEASVDGNNDKYIYVKKDGTAYFNAIITYLDRNGGEQEVMLSELAGNGTNDFEPGYAEFAVNFGDYVKNKGQMPDTGNIKYKKVTYFVIGAKESYVKLYQMEFTSNPQISGGYKTFLTPNGSIQNSGDGGRFTYTDGVLTVNGTTAGTYTVTIPVNDSFVPAEMTRLLMDVNSSVPFNVTLNLNDATVALRSEFFNHFNLQSTPAFLPAGEWKLTDMNLKGYFEWNGGVPTESTVQSVTITVSGTGTLTMNALQASRTGTIAYVKDGLSQSGAIDGSTPTKLTSSKYTINDYVSRVTVGTTVGQFKANFDQADSFIAVYTASGAAAKDSDTMKTGMTVRLVVNGSTIKQYQVAVTGDIRGTGVINTASARDLLQDVASAGALSAVNRLAADYDGNGSINTADARKMLYDVVG
ncbi:MAG: InlB B-repeat-containing protein [Clostridia bacterium]|nr:InlB B-repeat-containing protein [Clostridia bacterium]